MQSKNLKQLYAECRQSGEAINLSPTQSALYEASKLAAIGPFNMQNIKEGEKIHERLKWSRNQLATLGAYLIHLEFEQYKKFKFDTVDLDAEPEQADFADGRQTLQLRQGVTWDEFLALGQGMQGSDKLDFSIIDTQQQPGHSTRKQNANQEDVPKKQQKRRKE